MNAGSRRSRPEPVEAARKLGGRKRICSRSIGPDERTGLTRYDELKPPAPIRKGEDPVFLRGQDGLSILG